jgi:ketosteroid isomerase-like protein
MSDKMRVLQRGYEMIWREDRVEDALIGLGPDFEWIVPDHPDGELYRGPEAVIGFFRDWMAQFPGLQVDWELTEVDAERALAVFTQSGSGGASGAPVEMHNAQIWTWRDGRFTRMVMYYDVERARREVGLPTKSLADRVRDGVDAFRRGGIDAVLPTLTEDVVWEEDPDWPDGETWHGRETVRDVFRERLDTTTFVPHVEEVIERGNRALALMYWTAEGHGSGVVTELRPGVIYEFEGELAKRVQFFLDQDRARRAFEAE